MNFRILIKLPVDMIVFMTGVPSPTTKPSRSDGIIRDAALNLVIREISGDEEQVWNIRTHEDHETNCADSLGLLRWYQSDIRDDVLL